MVGVGSMFVEAFVKSFVQEIVSRVLSGIADQLQENASREDTMMKLEITLCGLSRDLEQTRDLAITDPDLRRILKRLKCAYNYWRDRLDGHKQQLAEGQEEVGQAVTVSSSQWYPPRLLPAPFNMKYLTSKHVKDIQWYVDAAKELVEKVSASSLMIRNNPHPMSFVRQLLAGESIRYETRQGSEIHSCWIRPVRLQERGVEVALRYKYSGHRSRPGKCFVIKLSMRVRESTDIVRIVKECLLKSLPSQLELVRDSAVHELDLLAHSQGTVTSSPAPPYDGFEAQYRESTLKARPNPFCCPAKGDDGPCANSTVVSSELSDMFPEEIIWFDFTCFAGAAVNYIFGASSDKDVIASRDIPEGMPPLEVNVSFLPHGKFGPARGAVELEGIMGGKQVHDVGSLQQFLEIVGSNATESFVHDPQLMKCTAAWIGNHGVSRVVVDKSATTMLQVLHSFETVKEQWAHDPEMHTQVLSQVFRMMQAEYPKSFAEYQLLVQVVETVTEQWPHDLDMQTQVLLQLLRIMQVQYPESFAECQQIVQILEIAAVLRAARQIRSIIYGD